MNNFIEWDSLDFKKSQGKEKIRCPKCDNERTDKVDKSLLINHQDGYGKCFYCESLTFRESKEYEIEYKLPIQDWKNFTKLSDKMVKYFEGIRKIHQVTLTTLGITEEKYYQPALKKEVINIVFNYFEGTKLVNKKYRSADKKFTQTSGSKSIFYNINSIIGQDECYIVEGEMDVLALHNIGIKNVISLPNGANDNDDYWKNSEKYIKNINNFIIATDNDAKGIIVREKIAQRLGRFKCEYIEWENKDANGDLIEGILDKTVKNRVCFPVSGTFKISDLYDNILNLYNNGLPDTIYPKHHSFGDLKKVFSTMRGHLVTITGIPSHGKSSYAEWYILNLIKDYKMKASFFSPEHSPMELHQTNFIQKAIGKNFWKDYPDCRRIEESDIKRYKEYFNEKLYITTAENGNFPTWDWLFDKFKEQMYSYGVDIFVIDAFNKLQLPNGNNLQEINKVLSKLTMFAQMNNVVIFLVVHPTKMKKNENNIYDMPTLYDCSGSADFRNQTHDGLCVYRYFEDEENGKEGYTTVINLKTKLSFQGEIGKTIDYDYHRPTGRYYAKGTNPPLFDMTLDNYDDDKAFNTENVRLPYVEPKEAFEEVNKDEIPF